MHKLRIGQVIALGVCWQTAEVTTAASPEGGNTFRPPSVPLVACDPYFSIWSPADALTDADTVHWTGKPHRLTSLVRIDGKALRIMGKEPANVPALPQVDLTVLPTRTIYTFEGQGIRMSLTFMTAALPDDLMVYSWPVTYLTWEATSTDGKKHAVQAYFEAAGELAVNEGNKPVACSSGQANGLATLKIGSAKQAVLDKKGDDLRIDWGYFYISAPQSEQAPRGPFHILHQGSVRDSFVRNGTDFVASGPAVTDGAGSSVFGAFIFALDEKVSSQSVSRWLMLAYDDEFSIQYFKKNLRPYWRRHGADAAALLKRAAAEYESLKKRCAAFDAELMAALTRAGGEKYAKLCALAYRQCYAANKVVADANGQPLMFPKENFSNGCIGTVDVIYPMAPQFLLFSPSLTKAMLVPILDYAASSRWRWPFAPHDLGTYPLANGQVYGGGERTETDQMPVEETGNMLIVLAALAQVEGNVEFCGKYWPMLEKWADYLKAKGFDPENQLCTDDFAGHLAHNVNLSAKAICGLGAFAKLCEMRHDQAKATGFMELAHEFTTRWAKQADDGDHFRLAFDKPATWSQKYNLVWDRILGLNLFPDSVRRQEMDFYKSKQNAFGLPLDNRKDYTKLDWTLWTATLTQDSSDFEALLNPIWRFLNQTPDRVPMTDWFWTQNAKKAGFQARSVVGGVFLQMLYDRAEWKKWAGRDKTKAKEWAPLPEPPKVSVIVPTSEMEPLLWRFTTEAPPDGWYKPEFNTSSWKEGPGGFGTKGTPGAVVRTEWKTADIWLRREFTVNVGPLPSDGRGKGGSRIDGPETRLPAQPRAAPNWNDLHLRIHHDEDAEVYLDGLLAAKVSGYLTDYETVPVDSQARAALGPGKHLFGVHCHQTTGGQFIDVGLVELRPEDTHRTGK